MTEARRVCRAYTRGFSLLEMILVLAIIMTVCLTMLDIFSQGYKFLRKAKFKIAAYNLARETIEKNFDWDALDALDGSPTDGVHNGTYPQTTQNLSLFGESCAYTISLVVSDGPVVPAEIKKLDVIVSWGEGSFTLTTYKVRDG